jgi:hypothetical protein
MACSEEADYSMEPEWHRQRRPEPLTQQVTGIYTSRINLFLFSCSNVILSLCLGQRWTENQRYLSRNVKRDSLVNTMTNTRVKERQTGRINLT